MNTRFALCPVLFSYGNLNKIGVAFPLKIGYSILMHTRYSMWRILRACYTEAVRIKDFRKDMVTADGKAA